MKGCLRVLGFLLLGGAGGFSADIPANLKTENLVAWCIVPFDAAKRSPEQRAAMLRELGITRCAYDWRKEHVAEFEEEILRYREKGIEFFAFWSEHPEAFRLFEKYDIHPQIWKTVPSPGKGNQEEKVTAAARALEPLAKKAAEAGCRLGLYNHGGWGGEPGNLVAVCRKLRDMGYRETGIVYNWHHGHGHIDDWRESLELLAPYLLCLNLNGMNPGANPKILALGAGKHEREMLTILIESGYDGPIGILDHQNHRDTREVLAENLAGLERLLKRD